MPDGGAAPPGRGSEVGSPAVTERILQGPFLTRAQAARRAGIPARLLVHRPDLLRVSGQWLPEVYFEFQFDEAGVRPDLGSVVLSLKGRYTDLEISDWLVHPNRMLGHTSPLRFLNGGGGVESVVAAAEGEGPVAGTGRPAARGPTVPSSQQPPMPSASAPSRRSGWRVRAPKPAFHGR